MQKQDWEHVDAAQRLELCRKRLTQVMQLDVGKVLSNVVFFLDGSGSMAHTMRNDEPLLFAMHDIVYALTLSLLRFAPEVALYAQVFGDQLPSNCPHWKILCTGDVRRILRAEDASKRGCDVDKLKLRTVRDAFLKAQRTLQMTGPDNPRSVRAYKQAEEQLAKAGGSQHMTYRTRTICEGIATGLLRHTVRSCVSAVVITDGVLSRLHARGDRCAAIVRNRTLRNVSGRCGRRE